jgi:GDP-4-dehydro-6-deoxy-D-mannose reductase
VRILVTGSNGFVGRHLCRHLAAIGDEVVAYPGPGSDGSLDITDWEAVRREIGLVQPEGIIHLAGVSSVAWSHAKPLETFGVNVTGTINLLQAVREAGQTARVLLVGSGEMYGRLLEGRAAREDHPLSPLSPYAASKCAAECVARQYSASYGLQAICARPFNHLGPGQAQHFVVPSFARQIADVKHGRKEPVIEVGDLAPVRDFLHVDDVIRGYRLLLEKGLPATAYNLCSGEPASIRTILEELLSLADVEVEVRVDAARLRPAEIPWLVGDNSRIGALGWRPQRSARGALKEALEEALVR